MVEQGPGGHEQATRKRRRPRWGCGHLLCLLGTLLSLGYLVAVIVIQRAFGEQHYLTFLLVYMPQPPLLVPLGAMALLAVLTRDRLLVGVNALLLVAGILALIPPTVPQRARATEGKTVRVVTWNLHENYHRTREMTEVLEGLQPDIVCLQEARRKSFATLLTGAEAAHTHEVTTLTRGKIVSKREIRLGAYPNYRWGLETVIDLPQGRVRVLNVHFITAFTGRTVRQNSYDLKGFIEHTREGRENETAAVLQWLSEPGTNKILAGDFNTPPKADIYRRITRVATDAFKAGVGWGLTYRRERPMVRIDYVFLKDGPRPVRARSLDGKVSDHRLVVADVLLEDRE